MTSPLPRVGLREEILGAIPQSLRDELFFEFNHLLANYREGRWGSAELNGGRFCEIVYPILQGHVSGTFPVKAQKPANMVDACRGLEKADATKFPRSVRIQIPRMLIALYEVRNNRGVGHVGGDVDPNHMDASVVVAIARWVVGELIRLFHEVDIAVATKAVDAVVERKLPVIWEIGGKKRVLAPNLSMKEKMLLLLYGASAGAQESDLVDWLEHSNASVFRRDVLRRAHKEKLIEYESKTGTVYISPLGVKYVEEKLPLEVT